MTTPTHSMTDSGAVVINQYHSHEHYQHDPRMGAALDLLATVQMEQQAAAVALRTLGATTMALVDEFRTLVSEVKSARESIAGSFRIFRDKLDQALADNAEHAELRASVEAIRDELETETDALTDLALANTEVAPPPPPPAG